MITRMILAAVLMGPVCFAWTDAITVDGKTYRDVLIHTSSNFYYVTVPDEGRVITVARADVDPSTVSIVDDPLYRDKLKATYDENRVAPKGKVYQSLDESEVVADAMAAVDAANEAQFSTGGGGNASAVADGGSATAAGLGISAAELQQAVQSAGGSMTQQGSQSGQPRYTGQAAGGQAQIDAAGPEENLKHLSLVLTAADTGQLLALSEGISPLMQKIAPWAEQWIMQNQAALMSGQPLEATQNNVHLAVQIGLSGQQVSLSIAFDSVG